MSSLFAALAAALVLLSALGAIGLMITWYIDGLSAAGRLALADIACLLFGFGAMCLSVGIAAGAILKEILRQHLPHRRPTTPLKRVNLGGTCHG